MIVSYEHNFVFIKTRKTAGTSIEIALATVCGPDDIITPIVLEDELLRLQNGKVAARNYAPDRETEARIAEAVLGRDEATFLRLYRASIAAGGFFNHMPAARIKRRLPPGFWASAFKFTVERHPYEKVVSRTYWEHRNAPLDDYSPAFEERAAVDPEDVDLYSIDGQIVVDAIIRQETLAKDLQHVAGRLGLVLPSLPKAKAHFRTDRRPASEILSTAQKALIYQRHRRTFDLLGYMP